MDTGNQGGGNPAWSVLGIDPSMTATGWAHMAKGDKAPTWGRISLPNWGDDEGQYLWAWFETIGHLMADKKVTHVFMELPITKQHPESLTENIATYGLVGQASIACHLLNRRGHAVEFRGVGVGQWREVYLGSAHAPAGLVKGQRRKWLKDKAKAQAALRGWLTDDDNEADALGIMTFGAMAIDPGFAMQQGPLFRRAESVFQDEVRELR